MQRENTKESGKIARSRGSQGAVGRGKGGFSGKFGKMFHGKQFDALKRGFFPMLDMGFIGLGRGREGGLRDESCSEQRYKG